MIDNLYENKAFFFIIILIKQTYKAKNIPITRYCCIFPLAERKDRNKLKRSEIEVKIIMK